MEKICQQIHFAAFMHFFFRPTPSWLPPGRLIAFMQPLQDDFRDPAAKDNSITNAATARSNLDAPITMRSAETELQNT